MGPMKKILSKKSMLDMARLCNRLHVSLVPEIDILLVPGSWTPGIGQKQNPRTVHRFIFPQWPHKGYHMIPSGKLI